jgi:hypothetical protein
LGIFKTRPSELKFWILSRKSQIGTVIVAVLLVAATATTTIALTSDPDSAVASTPDTAVRVSVIGDSYSSGFGNQIVWPSLVAAGSQLSISDVAFPGAGYVSGPGGSGPLAAQIDKALASKPAVVVVFGGMSDVSKADGLVAQSATDLFTELIRRAPTTKLIVLGPISHTDPVPEPYIKVDSAVAGAAKATHTTYVSMVHEKWLVGNGLIQDDDLTPTDQGQSILARHLSPILQGYVRKQDKATVS